MGHKVVGSYPPIADFSPSLDNVRSQQSEHFQMRGSGRPAIFLLVAIAVFIYHSGPSFADTRTIEGIVVNVPDGDTITVLDSN